jgi:hypothetical protein
MVSSGHPLPDGARVALPGLHAAADRLDVALVAYRGGGEAADVAVALTEAVMWVAALDEHAWKIANLPQYVPRRKAEPRGRVVGGLAYARNFHIHDLISTSHEATRLVRNGEIGDPPEGPARQIPSLFKLHVRLFKWDLLWVPFASLPPPKDPERWDRDQMYADAVAQGRLIDPIRYAIDWLNGFTWPK